MLPSSDVAKEHILTSDVQPSGVNWIAELPVQSQENVDYNDHFYRQRLRALQAVDELVDGLFERLEKYDLLDNTYIFYSTDNGYTIGQHRRQPGKESGFEEDINIPLIIRGPGVGKGKISSLVTTHTDLAPTFLSLIGASLDHELDGTAIPVHELPLIAAAEEKKWHEHVNVEFWGLAAFEGQYDTKVIVSFCDPKHFNLPHDLGDSIWRAPQGCSTTEKHKPFSQQARTIPAVRHTIREICG
jgi:hypothetical protein